MIHEGLSSRVVISLVPPVLVGWVIIGLQHGVEHRLFLFNLLVGHMRSARELLAEWFLSPLLLLV